MRQQFPQFGGKTLYPTFGLLHRKSGVERYGITAISFGGEVFGQHSLAQ